MGRTEAAAALAKESFLTCNWAVHCDTVHIKSVISMMSTSGNEGCNGCCTAQTTELKLRLCFWELEHARSHSNISFCLINVIISLDTYQDAQQTQHWKPWETNGWAIILRQVPFRTAEGDNILGTQHWPTVKKCQTLLKLFKQLHRQRKPESYSLTLHIILKTSAT